MIDSTLRLAVIVGSSRKGRFGHVVADWFVAQARPRPAFDVDVIDLAELDLPAHYPDERTPEVQAYVDRIDRADAVVVVTPEYNHAYPACLKQAIDLPYDEWWAKPVGFVSYGGISGGLRAVEQLRLVFNELQAVTLRDSVSFAMAHGRFDEAGALHDPVGPAAAADRLLDQLTWWADALRTARATRPNALPA
jgi:NAD(P)H-dependent FMN reductase